MATRVPPQSFALFAPFVHADDPGFSMHKNYSLFFPAFAVATPDRPHNTDFVFNPRSCTLIRRSIPGNSRRLFFPFFCPPRLFLFCWEGLPFGSVAFLPKIPPSLPTHSPLLAQPFLYLFPSSFSSLVTQECPVFASAFRISSEFFSFIYAFPILCRNPLFLSPSAVTSRVGPNFRLPIQIGRFFFLPIFCPFFKYFFPPSSTSDRVLFH